ncbi:hypothetical protein GQ43DRAFT_469220 [Delitschia confertaspora ATCC 74209]|uniref:Uncharacterized protein n=1 Tax=Delitschia confertaspora ATCC 74209 TaxID=1513339 RepID=A0A9P4JRK6_9PLEO|nr:hypothetical protein GQ43DRAFT_469220 [Delitschia confertaspora ATCC 74209]
MPLRLPPKFHRQTFSTAARVWPAIPSRLHAVHTDTHIPMNASTSQQLGRIGKWYLPTMALIAFSFAVVNALEEYNMAHMTEKQRRLAEKERNDMLLKAYGERMSLSDVEKALEVYEVQ